MSQREHQKLQAQISWDSDDLAVFKPTRRKVRTQKRPARTTLRTHRQQAVQR